jgi:acyl carrier protein
VDRSALPEPGRAPAVRSAVAGGTDTERQVADVWKRILGAAIVDPNENFFESGGNSLLAIRLFTMLKSTFDKKINLVDVFRYPTVRSFARFVDGAVASQPAPTRDDESSQRQRAIRHARLSGQAS